MMQAICCRGCQVSRDRVQPPRASAKSLPENRCLIRGVALLQDAADPAAPWGHPLKLSTRTLKVESEDKSKIKQIEIEKTRRDRRERPRYPQSGRICPREPDTPGRTPCFREEMNQLTRSRSHVVSGGAIVFPSVVFLALNIRVVLLGRSGMQHPSTPVLHTTY